MAGAPQDPGNMDWLRDALEKDRQERGIPPLDTLESGPALTPTPIEIPSPIDEVSPVNMLDTPDPPVPEETVGVSDPPVIEDDAYPEELFAPAYQQDIPESYRETAPSVPSRPEEPRDVSIRYMVPKLARAHGFNDRDAEIYSKLLMQESGMEPYNPDGSIKTSSAGALGIGQMMPGTLAPYLQKRGIEAKDYIEDPYVQIDISLEHLRGLLDKYDGSWAKALAAYNGGGQAVEYAEANGQYPPSDDPTTWYAQTLPYVAGILGVTNDEAMKWIAAPRDYVNPKVSGSEVAVDFKKNVGPIARTRGPIEASQRARIRKDIQDWMPFIVPGTEEALEEKALRTGMSPMEIQGQDIKEGTRAYVRGLTSGVFLLGAGIEKQLEQAAVGDVAGTRMENIKAMRDRSESAGFVPGLMPGMGIPEIGIHADPLTGNKEDYATPLDPAISMGAKGLSKVWGLVPWRSLAMSMAPTDWWDPEFAQIQTDRRGSGEGDIEDFDFWGWAKATVTDPLGKKKEWSWENAKRATMGNVAGLAMEIPMLAGTTTLMALLGPEAGLLSKPGAVGAKEALGAPGDAVLVKSGLKPKFTEMFKQQAIGRGATELEAKAFAESTVEAMSVYASLGAVDAAAVTAGHELYAGASPVEAVAKGLVAGFAGWLVGMAIPMGLGAAGVKLKESNWLEKTKAALAAGAEMGDVRLSVVESITRDNLKNMPWMAKAAPAVTKWLNKFDELMVSAFPNADPEAVTFSGRILSKMKESFKLLQQLQRASALRNTRKELLEYAGNFRKTAQMYRTGVQKYLADIKRLQQQVIQVGKDLSQKVQQKPGLREADRALTASAELIDKTQQTINRARDVAHPRKDLGVDALSQDAELLKQLDITPEDIVEGGPDGKAIKKIQKYLNQLRAEQHQKLRDLDITPEEFQDYRKAKETFLGGKNQLTQMQMTEPYQKSDDYLKTADVFEHVGNRLERHAEVLDSLGSELPERVVLDPLQEFRGSEVPELWDAAVKHFDEALDSVVQNRLNFSQFPDRIGFESSKTVRMLLHSMSKDPDALYQVLVQAKQNAYENATKAFGAASRELKRTQRKIPELEKRASKMATQSPDTEWDIKKFGRGTEAVKEHNKALSVRKRTEKRITELSDKHTKLRNEVLPELKKRADKAQKEVKKAKYTKAKEQAKSRYTKYTDRVKRSEDRVNKARERLKAAEAGKGQKKIEHARKVLRNAEAAHKKLLSNPPKGVAVKGKPKITPEERAYQKALRYQKWLQEKIKAGKEAISDIDTRLPGLERDAWLARSQAMRDSWDRTVDRLQRRIELLKTREQKLQEQLPGLRDRATILGSDLAEVEGARLTATGATEQEALKGSEQLLQKSTIKTRLTARLLGLLDDVDGNQHLTSTLDPNAPPPPLIPTDGSPVDIGDPFAEATEIWRGMSPEDRTGLLLEEMWSLTDDYLDMAMPARKRVQEIKYDPSSLDTQSLIDGISSRWGYIPEQLGRALRILSRERAASELAATTALPVRDTAKGLLGALDRWVRSRFPASLQELVVKGENIWRDMVHQQEAGVDLAYTTASMLKDMFKVTLKGTDLLDSKGSLVPDVARKMVYAIQEMPYNTNKMTQFLEQYPNMRESLGSYFGVIQMLEEFKVASPELRSWFRDDGWFHIFPELSELYSRGRSAPGEFNPYLNPRLVTEAMRRIPTIEEAEKLYQNALKTLMTGTEKRTPDWGWTRKATNTPAQRAKLFKAATDEQRARVLGYSAEEFRGEARDKILRNIARVQMHLSLGNPVLDPVEVVKRQIRSTIKADSVRQAISNAARVKVPNMVGAEEPITMVMVNESGSPPLARTLGTVGDDMSTGEYYISLSSPDTGLGMAPDSVLTIKGKQVEAKHVYMHPEMAKAFKARFDIDPNATNPEAMGIIEMTRLAQLSGSPVHHAVNILSDFYFNFSKTALQTIFKSVFGPGSFKERIKNLGGGILDFVSAPVDAFGVAGAGRRGLEAGQALRTDAILSGANMETWNNFAKTALKIQERLLEMNSSELKPKPEGAFEKATKQAESFRQLGEMWRNKETNIGGIAYNTDLLMNKFVTFNPIKEAIFAGYHYWTAVHWKNWGQKLMSGGVPFEIAFREVRREAADYVNKMAGSLNHYQKIVIGGVSLDEYLYGQGLMGTMVHAKTPGWFRAKVDTMLLSPLGRSLWHVRDPVLAKNLRGEYQKALLTAMTTGFVAKQVLEWIVSDRGMFAAIASGDPGKYFQYQWNNPNDIANIQLSPTNYVTIPFMGMYKDPVRLSGAVLDTEIAGRYVSSQVSGFGPVLMDIATNRDRYRPGRPVYNRDRSLDPRMKAYQALKMGRYVLRAIAGTTIEEVFGQSVYPYVGAQSRQLSEYLAGWAGVQIGKNNPYLQEKAWLSMIEKDNVNDLLDQVNPMIDSWLSGSDPEGLDRALQLAATGADVWGEGGHENWIGIYPGNKVRLTEDQIALVIAKRMEAFGVTIESLSEGRKLEYERAVRNMRKTLQGRVPQMLKKRKQERKKRASKVRVKTPGWRNK